MKSGCDVVSQTNIVCTAGLTCRNIRDIRDISK